MRKWIVMIAVFSSFSSIGQSETKGIKLPKELGEISGIARDGDAIWAIVDEDRNGFYQLSLEGKILHHYKIEGITMSDPEAIAADQDFVYIGDVGDNAGTRKNRQVFKVAKKDLRKENSSLRAERISFRFADEGVVKKKKSNNFDCEAMIVSGNSIYVFTKQRDDMHTVAYRIPNAAGDYDAEPQAKFKTKGLITDASLSPNGKELALVGYDDGHRNAFLYVFSDFKGQQFFSGRTARYELADEKKLDWQVESVDYHPGGELLLACEKTKDVPATLYRLSKSDLRTSDKD